MSRRWLVTCGILVLVLLPSLGYGDIHITRDGPEFWYLEEIPLPSGYSNVSWVAAADMAYLRNTTIPRLDMIWSGYVWTFDSILGLALAGPAGAALLPIAMNFVQNFLVNVGEDVGMKWLVMDWWLDMNTERFRETMRILKDEFGMSDYFIYATAELRGQEGVFHVVEPLGARLYLHVTSEKVPPIPPTRIVCLKFPYVKTQPELGSILYDLNLKGELGPVTVKRVFSYQTIAGKRIQDSKNPLQSLTTNDSGQIFGTIEIQKDPVLGDGGLRELHVYSPVNKGLLDQKIDDYVLALVLNPETVQVDSTGPQRTVNNNLIQNIVRWGDEIGFSVRIKGFHQSILVPVIASDGKSYPWLDLANDVFRGAFCEGPNGERLETRIVVSDPRWTEIYCKPRSEGNVTLKLQTLHGPVSVRMVQVVRKAEETTQLTEPKATQSTEPTATQGKYTDIGELRRTYLQKCVAMRNDYGKRYCEFVKNKSGCYLDPRGCWERIITAALPSEGSQARISCGTRLLDNYRECLEGCNGEFVTGAIDIYTLIGRADDCANAADGAVKACGAGAIDPPNKPTLAALPTSRLPGSESSPSPEASPGTPTPTSSQTSPKAPPSGSPAPPVPAEPAVTSKLGSNFSDEFNGTSIDSRWKVVNPNRDSSIRMTGNGGLRMTASPKEGGSDFAPGPNCNAPRVLQPVTGDWTMETRFNFAPTSRFQGAGFVICFDQNPESRNCWRVIERQFWGPGQIVNFSGDQKLFPSSTTYLRLRKKGALYTAWFSADGRTWTEAGTREERRTPVFAGIMTLCQSYDRNMNLYSVADFDYLRFTQN